MTSEDDNTVTALNNSKPRVAIPVPNSEDMDYSERVLPRYEEAVRAAGGSAVRIALDSSAEEIAATLAGCDAVILPGSRADVDPRQYHAARHEKTADADAKRDAVDRMLIEDAYRARKPVLGICYGLQSLNVIRGGSLVQDIESQFNGSKINHNAGKTVANAHTVKVDPRSRLAGIVGAREGEAMAVNSSHHQAAEAAGKGLRIVAYSPTDGVVEALEGTDADHFVLAVQWHPERSVGDGPEVADSARAIFRALVEAAGKGRKFSTTEDTKDHGG